MTTPKDSARSLAGRIRSDEDGATLVIFALVLVVLLGFAALAVDLSGLFVVRRHAQTAADVGVLSGAQFTSIDPSATTAQARQAVIDEVKSITAGNLDSADWATCVDAGRPSEFTPVSGETDCISFTVGLTKIRVRVPDQTFSSFFAGVLGVDTLTTSAKAVAGGLQYKTGDIFPFGVPSGAQADAVVGCPHDYPNHTEPCDGPDHGNFNNVSITQWGLNPPPNKKCNPSTGEFEDNIAKGADHLLGVWSTSPFDDEIVCADPNIGNPPGMIHTEPGNTQTAYTPGLVTGNTKGSGFDGRLTDTPYSTISFMGETVDNEPLWGFIGTDSDGSDISLAPASCGKSTFDGGDSDWDEDLLAMQGLDPVLDDPDYKASDPTSHLEPNRSFEHMARCLREYKDGVWDPGTGPLGAPPYAGAHYGGETYSTPIFTATGVAGTNPEKGIYNLQVSPRWGWSPVGVFLNGNKDFKIEYFKPIFLELVVDKCHPNATRCDREWYAGQTPTGGNFQKIRSIVSFQLPNGTLPETVFTYGPGSEFAIEYTLIE